MGERKMIYVYWTEMEPVPLKEKYKTHHQKGQALLKYGIIDRFGASAKNLLETIKRGEYGKPYFKSRGDIHFNISHSDGVAACAVSDNPVGIDVEDVAEFHRSILEMVLTEKERAFLEGFKNDSNSYNKLFFRFWTLKESYIKYRGLGLSLPMTDFSFKLDLEAEPVGIKGSMKDAEFAQMVLSEKTILSICSKQAPKFSLKYVGANELDE